MTETNNQPSKEGIEEDIPQRDNLINVDPHHKLHQNSHALTEERHGHSTE
ncbi:hypothetical protein [Synechococcus sp. MIT S1220]